MLACMGPFEDDFAPDNHTHTAASIGALDQTTADARYAKGAYARWPLSDEVGAVAVEMVGDHEGTYVGDPIMSHDGVTFVGNSSQYISLPILEYGSLLAGSTIEFWLNTSTGDSGFVFGTINSADSMLMQLMVNGTSVSAVQPNSDRSILRIRSATGGVSAHWSTPDIPYDGTWHHVVITISEEPVSVGIWVDGAAATVAKSGPSALVGDLRNFDHPLTLGGRNNQGTVDLPFDGSIREFKIYPYSVDNERAQGLYTTASGLPPRWTRNWTWWTRPRAVAYDGKLFVMGSWGTDVGLDIYDIDGNRTPYRLARYEFEDHNNGAVLIRTGKPMVTMWTRHSRDRLVRYRVGAVNIEEATTREDYLGTAEHNFTASNNTTYQVTMDIGGTIWVLNRVSLPHWAVRTSTAWDVSGITWGPERAYVGSTDGKQMYTAAVDVGTTIRTACCNHPVNGSGMQGIYYGEINTVTGAVTGANGAALGTLGTEINHSALQTVYVPAAGWSTWIYDVGDNPTTRELTFVTFDPANRDTTAVYKYARWSGTAWVVTDIIAAGKRFVTGAGDTEPYYGSVHMRRGTPGGVVYLAREASGTWYIERRTSTDLGVTWTPEVLASFVEHPRQNFTRVFPVEGDGSYPAEAVFVHTFRWSTFTSYRSDFVLYPEPIPSGAGGLDVVTADARYVNAVGDTMSGALTLNADPASPMHAATKQYVDAHAGAANAQTINAQTGTAYTIQANDSRKIVTLNNAATIALTVPLNSTQAFPIGGSVDLIQLGAGQILVAPAGGVTINTSMATPKSRAQYSVLTLIKIATDTWVLTGDAAAS